MGLVVNLSKFTIEQIKETILKYRTIGKINSQSSFSNNHNEANLNPPLVKQIRFSLDGENNQLNSSRILPEIFKNNKIPTEYEEMRRRILSSDGEEDEGILSDDDEMPLIDSDEEDEFYSVVSGTTTVDDFPSIEGSDSDFQSVASDDTWKTALSWQSSGKKISHAETMRQLEKLREMTELYQNDVGIFQNILLPTLAGLEKLIRKDLFNPSEFNKQQINEYNDSWKAKYPFIYEEFLKATQAALNKKPMNELIFLQESTAEYKKHILPTYREYIKAAVLDADRHGKMVGDVYNELLSHDFGELAYDNPDIKLDFMSLPDKYYIDGSEDVLKKIYNEITEEHYEKIYPALINKDSSLKEIQLNRMKIYLNEAGQKLLNEEFPKDHYNKLIDERNQLGFLIGTRKLKKDKTYDEMCSKLAKLDEEISSIEVHLLGLLDNLNNKTKIVDDDVEMFNSIKNSVVDALDDYLKNKTVDNKAKLEEEVAKMKLYDQKFNGEVNNYEDSQLNSYEPQDELHETMVNVLDTKKALITEGAATYEENMPLSRMMMERINQGIDSVGQVKDVVLNAFRRHPKLFMNLATAGAIGATLHALNGLINTFEGSPQTMNLLSNAIDTYRSTELAKYDSVVAQYEHGNSLYMLIRRYPEIRSIITDITKTLSAVKEGISGSFLNPYNWGAPVGPAQINFNIAGGPEASILTPTANNYPASTETALSYNGPIIQEVTDDVPETMIGSGISDNMKKFHTHVTHKKKMDILPLLVKSMSLKNEQELMGTWAPYLNKNQYKFKKLNLPVLNYNLNYVKAIDYNPEQKLKILNDTIEAPIITDHVSAQSVCAINRWTVNGAMINQMLPFNLFETVKNPVTYNRVKITPEYLRERIQQDTQSMLRFKGMPIQGQMIALQQMANTSHLLDQGGYNFGLKKLNDVNKKILKHQGYNGEMPQSTAVEAESGEPETMTTDTDVANMHDFDEFDENETIESGSQASSFYPPSSDSSSHNSAIVPPIFPSKESKGKASLPPVDNKKIMSIYPDISHLEGYSEIFPEATAPFIYPSNQNKRHAPLPPQAEEKFKDVDVFKKPTDEEREALSAQQKNYGYEHKYNKAMTNLSKKYPGILEQLGYTNENGIKKGLKAKDLNIIREHGKRAGLYNFKGLGIIGAMNNMYNYHGKNFSKPHHNLHIYKKYLARGLREEENKPSYEKRIGCQICKNHQNLKYNKSKGFLCHGCYHGHGMTSDRTPVEELPFEDVNSENPNTKDFHEQTLRQDYDDSMSKMEFDNSWTSFEKSIPKNFGPNFINYARKNYIAFGDFSEAKLDRLVYLLGYITMNEERVTDTMIANLNALSAKYLKTVGNVKPHDDIDYSYFSNFDSLKEYIKQYPGVLLHMEFEK